jgi:hypothetical protein
VTTGESPNADGLQGPFFKVPDPGDPGGPPDREPSIGILPPNGGIVAGVSVTINLRVDPGATHLGVIQGGLPKVRYTGVTVTLDTGQRIADHTTGGWSFAVTFPQPGAHWIVAVASTAEGRDVGSQQLNVWVDASHPPIFAVELPVVNDVFRLDERGSPVEVKLATTGDQFGPLTVSIAWDGQTQAGQFTGTTFDTTIHLDRTPLGPQSISVTCTDPGGLQSTQTRPVIKLGAAPPLPLLWS